MPALEIRPYADTDEDALLPLLAASLGKTVDQQYREFFRWKHLQNPFGRSFMWVGEVDGRLAGFRAFLRWRFTEPGGERAEAVRAVDTATHPDFQGMGIFRTLTLHALDELREAGVDFVFNTPNDQSRPGYLKMGWSVVGRVPVQLRPRSAPALLRLARARTAAALWSEPSTVGVPAVEVLSDHAGVGRLLEAAVAEPGDGLRTDRSVEFLRWRYTGFAPVASRIALAGSSVSDGYALFRLRRRGPALECTVGDLCVPGDGRAGARLVRHVLSETRADYALAGAPGTARLPGFIATDRLGPVLTWRAPGGGGVPPSFRLSLGDVELF